MKRTLHKLQILVSDLVQRFSISGGYLALFEESSPYAWSFHVDVAVPDVPHPRRCTVLMSELVYLHHHLHVKSRVIVTTLHMNIF